MNHESKLEDVASGMMFEWGIKGLFLNTHTYIALNELGKTQGYRRCVCTASWTIGEIDTNEIVNVLGIVEAVDHSRQAIISR